jgi:hypothetical protein
MRSFRRWRDFVPYRHVKKEFTPAFWRKLWNSFYWSSSFSCFSAAVVIGVIAAGDDSGRAVSQVAAFPIAAAIGWFALSGIAQAQSLETLHQSGAVESGVETVFAHGRHWNTAPCIPLRTTVAIVKPPAHGTVRIVDEINGQSPAVTMMVTVYGARRPLGPIDS